MLHAKGTKLTPEATVPQLVLLLECWLDIKAS
jgi:hypothetical protein